MEAIGLHKSNQSITFVAQKMVVLPLLNGLLAIIDESLKKREIASSVPSSIPGGKSKGRYAPCFLLYTIHNKSIDL